MSMQVAGIEIPVSSMALAAARQLRDAAPALLLAHSARSYCFAALLGKRRRITVDLDLLFVASMFHGYGLLDAYRHSQERYEIDGANAARSFLRQFPVDEAHIGQVWEAIALHTTPGIPRHKPALVALMAAGVEVDLLGYHLADMTRDECQDVLTAYPREREFKLAFLDYLAGGQAHRPDSTFGTVNADVLDRRDATFRRLNYCGLVLGSSWQE